MAKVIMVQGTTSNAGKSLTVAALCRIFSQDGYKVAPFKSQNMALNSCITQEGLEMGRAQVVQAEAARCAPDVRMNPVLLKPTSDCGSQVIVNGEVFGNMDAKEYHSFKKTLAPKVLEAYESLAAQNDIIVIEGAGSPAEINLKENDIVNMGMARMAQAPVVLVADIDRGGVFASLYGTYALLDDEDRRHLKATIINKFRGDKDILQPGIDMLKAYMPTPVAGVVPYLNVRIDDEDSLSSVFETSVSDIDIAVMRVPKISNFTDFSAFEMIGGVPVRYVSRVEDFGSPDLVILPGTKSTLDDMRYLRESGLEARIKQYAGAGGPVFGICGGYQMLSESLFDPYGVEGGGSLAGMGLLSGETVFQEEKRRTQVAGTVECAEGFFSCLVGKKFSGYEIHMGTTNTNKAMNTIVTLEGTKSSDGSFSHNVCGTYVHGFFDSEEVMAALLSSLAQKKGLVFDPCEIVDLATRKDREYDTLAAEVRSALDMDFIYQILEEGV